MRASATNVGLTAYVQNDSGEYTPQPFEMMSESQMVVFEHHIVGISVAVRATLTRTRAQTRSTCHVSRATLMPSPVCARHQMILKKKPGRRPFTEEPSSGVGRLGRTRLELLRGGDELPLALEELSLLGELGLVIVYPQTRRDLHEGADHGGLLLAWCRRLRHAHHRFLMRSRGHRARICDRWLALALDVREIRLLAA